MGSRHACHLQGTHRKINISGIDNHEVNGLDVVTAATLLNTSLGKVIGIFNEYGPSWGRDHPSIHQVNLNGSRLMLMKSLSKSGGTQHYHYSGRIFCPSLLIKDGLAYATSLGRPTDQDMDTYPHVFFYIS